MCLSYQYSKKKQLSIIRRRKVLTCWKIANIADNRAYPIFFLGWIPYKRVNYLDRVTIGSTFTFEEHKLCGESTSYLTGYHLFLTRQMARNYKNERHWGSTKQIIKCEVEVKDIITIGAEGDNTMSYSKTVVVVCRFKFIGEDKYFSSSESKSRQQVFGYHTESS